MPELEACHICFADEMMGESVGIMSNILNGAWPCIPDHGFPVVDVDDVAAAHSLALVTPEAHGRCIIVSLVMWDAMIERYPVLERDTDYC